MSYSPRISSKVNSASISDFSYFRRMTKTNLYFLLLVTFLFSCVEQQAPEPMFEKEPFGEIDLYPVDLYTLGFEGKLIAQVTNYGGIVTSLKVPDKDGNMEDIVLGFDDIYGYMRDNPFFGALVGRYGNRIAGGKFTLDGEEYTLAQNNGPNSLHGGIKGFDKVVWSVTDTFQEPGRVGLVMKYVSLNGEEGFPGTLDCEVTYTFTPTDFRIQYKATTDQKTIVNLTQHSYFNLSGDLTSTHLDHVLKMDADQYLPVDSTLIPTGELRDVSGTPFDFTAAKPIGQDINADNEQIAVGGGYDHCWVLNGEMGELRSFAEVHHPGSGRTMEVLTTEPGVQFYTGNFLDGVTGKGDEVYPRRSGFCLETQHYPDSPNQPDFPSVVLEPDQTYSTETIYRFGVKQ